MLWKGTLCHLSLEWRKPGGKVAIDFVLLSHLASYRPMVLGSLSLSQPLLLPSLLLGPEVP